MQFNKGKRAIAILMAFAVSICQPAVSVLASDDNTSAGQQIIASTTESQVRDVNKTLKNGKYSGDVWKSDKETENLNIILDNAAYKGIISSDDLYYTESSGSRGITNVNIVMENNSTWDIEAVSGNAAAVSGNDTGTLDETVSGNEASDVTVIHVNSLIVRKGSSITSKDKIRIIASGVVRNYGSISKNIEVVQSSASDSSAQTVSTNTAPHGYFAGNVAFKFRVVNQYGYVPSKQLHVEYEIIGNKIYFNIETREGVTITSVSGNNAQVIKIPDKADAAVSGNVTAAADNDSAVSGNDASDQGVSGNKADTYDIYRNATDITYSYVLINDSGNTDAAIVDIVVNDPAAQEITTEVDDVVKTTVGSEMILIDAVSTGYTDISYEVSDDSIIRITDDGAIAIKGAGIANIFITAQGTDEYDEVHKTITVKVAPKVVTIKKIKVKNKKQAVVYWTKSAKATGVQLQYSSTRTFKKGTTKSVKVTRYNYRTIKRLLANKKYYVRVRSYASSADGTVYSAWSSIKAFKTKKK